MKNNTLTINFEAETDILDIQIGEPTESYFDEIEDDLFEGHDENTGEIKGYKIFNFTKRGGLRNIKIPLPEDIEIKQAA